MKLAFSIFSLLSLMLIVSCDNKADDENTSNYTYNKSEVVSAVSQAFGGNDISIYDTVSGNYRVIVTSSTLIWKERPSRSGSDLAAYSDVFPGDTIKFSFDDKDISYQQRPLVVRPPEIWAYSSDNKLGGTGTASDTNAHIIVIVNPEQ